MKTSATRRETGTATAIVAIQPAGASRLAQAMMIGTCTRYRLNETRPSHRIGAMVSKRANGIQTIATATTIDGAHERQSAQLRS